MLSSKKHVNVRPKQVSNILKKKIELDFGEWRTCPPAFTFIISSAVHEKKIIYDFNHVF